MKKLGILGLGWFGLELGNRLKEKYEVVGTKRSQADISKLHIQGVKVFPLDLSNPLNPEIKKSVFDVEFFVLNVPPGIRKNGSSSLYLKMMAKALDALNTFRVEHLIFISSTGVFGKHQTRVDENSTPQPDTESGNALLEAEELFRNQFKGYTTVLRPAGLVGKERHPVKYLSGRDNISGQFHPVNLVHLEDLIQLTQFLLECPNNFPVVHAVTEHHPLKGAYYAQIASKKSLLPPSFDPKDESEGRRVDSIYHKDQRFPKYTYTDLFQFD